VKPNTVIDLQQLGFVVLNEQVCDGGAYPVLSGSVVTPCSGGTTGHSGLTISSIHVVLTVPSLIGLEVFVTQAHSDATFK
jgi:hypothetical protein